MKRVTGPRLALALRTGALAVVRRQGHLTAIEVFPVPEADAGTPGAAEALVERLEALLPGQVIPVLNTGPALGVHAGPGAVGVAVRPEGGLA